MSKTKEIEVSCSTVSVAHANRKINVVLEEPNITELLTTVHEDDLTEYVRAEFIPEDVFSQSELEKWAEDNGYTKGE